MDKRNAQQSVNTCKSCAGALQCLLLFGAVIDVRCTRTSEHLPTRQPMNSTKCKQTTFPTGLGVSLCSMRADVGPEPMRPG